jgi:hypothetical protein
MTRFGKLIVAAAREQPDALAVAVGEDAESVVLDLVQPVGAGRRLRGR